MAAGIWTLLTLSALALLFLTFRSGVKLYQKILAYTVLGALFYFYWPDFQPVYARLTGGDYKTLLSELTSVVQISLPAVVFVLVVCAFFVASALDAGKILIFLFVVFILSTIAKIVSL
ncbi:MAG: hypothetical protein LDLANPLL_01405 [Turneriella sp.]|nr:hypothetical protein [Turneriella sp.]